jgi:hypothetical protein
MLQRYLPIRITRSWNATFRAWYGIDKQPQNIYIYSCISQQRLRKYCNMKFSGLNLAIQTRTPKCLVALPEPANRLACESKSDRTVSLWTGMKIWSKFSNSDTDAEMPCQCCASCVQDTSLDYRRTTFDMMAKPETNSDSRLGSYGDEELVPSSQLV